MELLFTSKTEPTFEIVAGFEDGYTLAEYGVQWKDSKKFGYMSDRYYSIFELEEGDILCRFDGSSTFYVIEKNGTFHEGHAGQADYNIEDIDLDPEDYDYDLADFVAAMKTHKAKDFLRREF